MPHPVQAAPQHAVQPTTNGAGPSFRCDRAGSSVERLICQSAPLSALDRSVADAFAAARQAAPPDRVAGLQAEQASWLRQRNACGPDEHCLAEAMRTRAAQLATRQAASGPLQAASSGGREFDAPPVNRLILLKLLMASRPDLFRNDVAPLLYRALIDRFGSPECARDLAAVKNELRLDSYIAENRAWIEARIAEAASSPVVRLRFDGPVVLGRYDDAAGAFEMPMQQSAGSPLSADAVAPYGDPVITDIERGACPYSTPTSLVRQAGEHNVMRTLHPVLHVQGGQAIRSLPMPRAAASAWLDTIRAGSPAVRIETVVEASGQQDELMGRIVAARAVDPNTGAVLHVYAPSELGGASAPPAPQAGEAFVASAPSASDAPGRATLHARVAPSSAEAAPPADFPTLYDLLLAARPDMGKQDDAVLLWRAVRLVWNTPECDEIRRDINNEIKRRDLIAQLRPAMQSALEAVRQADPKRTVTVSMPVLLGAYDKEQQHFALMDMSATPAARRVTVEPRKDWCQDVFARDLPANGLSFAIDDGGALTNLPMTAAAASARLDRPPAQQPRSARIDAVVTVAATEQGLAARLVSAKAVDPRDGEVLHVYAPQADRPEAAGEAVPATRPVLAFEALRLDPAVLSDDGLLRMTKSQIQLDQFAYQSAGGGARYTSGDAHVFAFALDDVRGKNPDFAAPELAPQMRALLTRLAATAPGQLYAGRTLAGSNGKMPDYDHATSTLRLHCCYFRPGLVSGSFELLSPPLYFQRGANLATNPVPGAAGEIDRRAIYGLELPKQPDPPPALDAKQAGLGFMGWEGPQIVALDRVLELDGVKLPPAEAEQVFQDVHSANSMPDQIYSRVVFTPESLISAPGGRGSILLAHLDSAELRTPSGQVFARLPASAFPLAADRAAAMMQQASAAAGAAQASAQATAAQRLADQHARETAAQSQAQSGADAVRLVAASARAGTPYGPEIVGLRLGLPMAQAESVIHDHMPGGVVLQGKFNYGGIAMRDLGPVKIFVSQDRNEQITLLEGPGKTVAGIRRSVAMDGSFTDAQALDMLRTKYGPPHSAAQQSWTWGTENFPCGLVRGSALTLAVIEGSPPNGADFKPRWSPSGFTLDPPAPGSPKPDLARMAACEPLLQVSRDSERLMESLYDMRIFAVDQADQQADLTHNAVPPKL